MAYTDRKMRVGRRRMSSQVKTRGEEPSGEFDLTAKADKTVVELRNLLDKNEVNTPEIEKMLADAQSHIRMVTPHGWSRDAEEHARIATRILEDVRSSAGISTHSKAGDMIDSIQWMLKHLVDWEYRTKRDEGFPAERTTIE